VIAHDRLAALGAGTMTVAAPVNRPPDPVVPFRRPMHGDDLLRRRLDKLK
jgi:hypothetical protein